MSDNGGPLPAGQVADLDPEETREWVEALEAVLEHDGSGRAEHLLDAVVSDARLRGLHPHSDLATPYVNTISIADQPTMPGDPDVERDLRNLVRWNAMAMVVQANRASADIGGHIASFQSAATLYEVGFNHFWKADDLIFFQGHSSPGIYARAFLEGRLSEERVRRFRHEVGSPGLSSYPHPWLMPDFWQFPTVSMGLGPLMAIYQARFLKYLQARGLVPASGRRVWAFVGDGETDEPESLGAIGVAGRERLDNLVFVVNCNLQRLDGPVRGNGKIIQELETEFRGAGWNVIKVIWGSRWDALLAADRSGALVRRMQEALDGDYQLYKARDGAFVREHFFGTSPELRALVEDLSDAEIWALNRGGHDPVKVYAAYDAATRANGKPTVILAKTIKGYGMGDAGEALNTTHSQKKMTESALMAFRNRFALDLDDDEVRGAQLHRPADDAPEMVYLHEHRQALGGALPARTPRPGGLAVPELSAFHTQLEGSGERRVSTTMAFVRVLTTLLRDRQLGPRVVPIVPDEFRTFGMEGLFRQLGIWSQDGQRYESPDASQLMAYREDVRGQILQEGINEPGAMSSWIAAATSYANHGLTMIPFYVYYSMFGFQRVGDLAWAAGDSRARGFLVGGTAGRTTLNGEGLQHEDGHSHIQASLLPTCVAYDPAYGYEVAVIVQDGLRRMVAEEQDVFFYLTVMNENYPQPPMPPGAEEGILRGLHRVAGDGSGDVQLLGSGTILGEVLAARGLLGELGVTADVYSVTSFTELRRDGLEVERHNRLHPGQPPRTAHVTQVLRDRPTVAATDYVRQLPDLIRAWVPGRYDVLGTDGYGRSDTRAVLRRFFEVDRQHVTVAALHASGRSEAAAQAIRRFGIDTESEPPWRR